MFDLLNLNPGTFGLDISDLSLKIACIRRQGNKLRFSALAGALLASGIIQQGEIRDPGKLAKAIKRLVGKTQGLKTRHVVIALPEEKSFVRLLQMPPMTKGEIKSAVRFEAENYIPFSPEKVYLDSQIIQPFDSQSKHTEVLLAALPRKTVDPYVTVLEQAGLVPMAMETESQATARALIKGQKTKRPVFIADIGATCTNFSLYFGNSLRFTSFIPFSSNKLTTAIANALKVEPAEAKKIKALYGFQQTGKRAKKVFEALLPVLTEFAWEIKKHIDYYQTHAKHEEILSNGKEVRKLLLCGGGANLRGLIKFLSQETGLIVQKGNPLVNLPWEDSRTKDKSRQKLMPYATAIGLALRGQKTGDV